jgi:hypothetical protein
MDDGAKYKDQSNKQKKEGSTPRHCPFDAEKKRQKRKARDKVNRHFISS